MGFCYLIAATYKAHADRYPSQITAIHIFTPLTMPNITDAKCVLVIGATAGIGRALALAIRDLPQSPVVIVGGRRQERIDELTKNGENIEGVQIDVTAGREKLKEFVDSTIAKYPDVCGMFRSLKSGES